MSKLSTSAERKAEYWKRKKARQKTAGKRKLQRRAMLDELLGRVPPEQ